MVAELGVGGVENWLLNVVRLRRQPVLPMDLAITGFIDPEVRARFEAMDVRVFECPSTYEPLRIAANLRRILREHGPYDLLHCHMHRGNGHVALVGRFSGVPAIVVHSHVDSMAEDAGAGAVMRAKTWIAAMLQKSADAGFACSVPAGDSLFDPGWRQRHGWRVLHYGVDFEPFAERPDRRLVREQFGLPPDAFAVAFVGRCEPQKNPELLFDLSVRYVTSNPDAYVLVIGDGSLRPGLEARVRDRGLGDRIRFLGARHDVPALLLGMADAFLLPSLYEGFGIALLEAQAAGLPAVVSDRIPAEARVLPSVEVVPIGRPVEDWCAALDRARSGRVDPDRAIASLRQAGYAIDDSVRSLERSYREILASLPPRPGAGTRPPSSR